MVSTIKILWEVLVLFILAVFNEILTTELMALKPPVTIAS